MAALLEHLEHRGYPYSPRFLGVDEPGRDVLSRVPGEPVPTLRGETQLVEVGHAVAAFSEAVRDATRLGREAPSRTSPTPPGT